MLFIGNDHEIELTNLKDNNGNIITGATVTATLYELNRMTKAGGVVWPVTLSDQGGGTYSAVLDDAVDITEGRSYELQVEAVSGSTRATWWQREAATLRRFAD